MSNDKRDNQLVVKLETAFAQAKHGDTIPLSLSLQELGAIIVAIKTQKYQFDEYKRVVEGLVEKAPSKEALVNDLGLGEILNKKQ